MSTATKGLRRAGIGGLAALIALTGLATATPAFADLAAAGGDIRVAPVSATDALNQPAPVIYPGVTTAQAGADVQLLVPNTFKSGDRILVSLFDSANANCSDKAHTVSYAAAPTVTSSVAYTNATPVMAPNDGIPDPAAVAESPTADTATGTAAPTTPTFNVNLMASSSCAPNSLNDVLAITMSNQASGAATDSFVLTVKGITYNVGASVHPGPLHVAAFGQNAVPGTTPQQYTNSPVFGGNLWSGTTGATILQWTNNAFVSPVKFSLGAPSQLVADNTFQTLGDITIAETQADSIGDGVYTLTFANAEVYAGAPAPTVSGAATGETATVAATGTPTNTVALTLGTTSGTTTSSYVIKGVILKPLASGPITATLTSTNAAFTAAFTPDDQTTSNSAVSDVNQPAATVSVTAVSLPFRIGGNDRYETAAKIALNNGCANIAIIANGSNFPDALSANFLAGHLQMSQLGETYSDVPILLTTTNSVPAVTMAALANLGVRHVYIVGGTGVVSAAVQTALTNTRAYYCGGEAAYNNQNLLVDRVGGADRYATNRLAVQLATNVYPSVASYQFLSTFGQPSKATAILATGEVAADALASGPMAYTHFPLVLTNTASLNTNASQTLTNLNIKQVIIVGGTGAVSSAVETALTGQGISVIRLAGATRYETATKIADFERTPVTDPVQTSGGLGWTSTTSYLARGDIFADALAGGPLAGSRDSSILLTTPTALSTETNTWLTANASTLDTVIALGLTGAVSNAALDAANAAVAG